MAPVEYSDLVLLNLPPRRAMGYPKNFACRPGGRSNRLPFAGSSPSSSDTIQRRHPWLFLRIRSEFRVEKGAISGGHSITGGIGNGESGWRSAYSAPRSGFLPHLPGPGPPIRPFQAQPPLRGSPTRELCHPAGRQLFSLARERSTTIPAIKAANGMHSSRLARRDPQAAGRGDAAGGARPGRGPACR